VKSPALEWLLAFVLAGLVALYAIICFNGADQFYRLWYYTPAALVVGSLMVDHFKNRASPKWLIILDLLVVSICICRPLLGWPAASGHAIFFVYAFLTASSHPTRIFAVILGIVTLYAKILLWNWDKTLWPGLIIGGLAGCIYLRMRKMKRN
jgi:hypothetical protein